MPRPEHDRTGSFRHDPSLRPVFVPWVGDGSPANPFRPDTGDLPLSEAFNYTLTRCLDPHDPHYGQPIVDVAIVLVRPQDIHRVTTRLHPSPRNRAIAPISNLPFLRRVPRLALGPALAHFTRVADELREPSGDLPPAAIAALAEALSVAVVHRLHPAHARSIAGKLGIIWEKNS